MNFFDLPREYDSLYNNFLLDTYPEPDPPLKISVSLDITEGFIPVEVNFAALPGIVLSKMNYSPTEFANGHRCLENARPGNNLIVLDIDDGWQINEAVEFLDEENLMALISTTKSHQIPKNDTPAHDRFRIFLPTLHPFEGSTNEFRCLMQNIFKYFKGKPDKATCDMSRFFYGNSNPNNQGYHFTKGWKLVDWNTFDRKPEREVGEIKLIQGGDANKLEEYWIREGVVGNRNNVLFKAYAYYKNQQLSSGEVVDKVFQLNRKLVNPLEEAEVRSICRL